MCSRARVCVRARTRSTPGCRSRALDLLELELLAVLSHMTWLMGTKLYFSETATRILIHRMYKNLPQIFSFYFSDELVHSQ